MSPTLSAASPAAAATLENGGAVSADEQSFVFMDNFSTLAILPQVLNVSIELDLFSIIAKGGGQLTAAEIADQLPVKNRDTGVAMLDRMLRLLASYSVVTCTLDAAAAGSSSRPQRRYGLSPAAKYLLPDEDGLSLAWVSNLVWHKALVDARDKLKDAVLEGGVPFTMAHGMTAFEYASKDQSLNKVFNNAMDSYSRILIKNILQRYHGFQDVTQLVDVAGGLGHMVGAIVSKYPHIKGINFDLPHVVRDAPPYPGVEQVPGDMFEKIPEGDAILLKWITHNWTDEHCIKLFKNCHTALTDKGKLIVVEGMLSETPETTVGQQTLSQLDLFMMTQMPDGRERTKEEFTALANAAGFVDIKFACCVCNSWIIELTK